MTHQTQARDSNPVRPPTLSITDIIETRVGHTSHMHWPVDPETTAKLKRVIRLDLDSPVPWYRRLIRLLRFF